MSTKTNNKKDEQLQIDSPAYEKSDALKQAEAQLQQHISNQPAAYSFQYQDRMNDLLTKLDSRPSFQYDADADALYQYYKDRYVQNGQRAMEDTMGQAAALTGGYGSSYAQSVGQQTYNEYMQGLNDVIPELYQLALSKYNQDTASLQDQYAMYANLNVQDYSRWQEEQDRWYDQLDRLTDNARYEAEQDYERQQEELETFRLCENKARELVARMEVLSQMGRPGRLDGENRRRLLACGANIRDQRPLDSVLERDVVTNYHVRQILKLRRELLDALKQ